MHKSTIKTVFSLLFVPVFALISGMAHAGVYICKDASGRTISSDRPIPECADRTVRELDKNGVVKREIPPPPTAEEKQQQKALEEKRKADMAVAQEQKRSDRAIMSRYRNEEEIEVARKRSVDMLQEPIKRENALIATAEEQLKKAQDEMEGYKKKNAKPPADLSAKAEDSERMINDGKKRIAVREAEITHVNEKFDQTLKRYREITGAAANK